MTEKLWEIEPSGPLRGDVTVRGAKNAVSKHMVAAMLGAEPSTIRNAPDVGEVGITAGMLEHVGTRVERSGGEITVVPGPVADPSVGKAFTGLNRIPILMLGPLLHLAGEAFVPLVGGDPIGRRPVNFHVEALRAMGAEVEVGDTGIFAKAGRLTGDRIEAFSYLAAGLVTGGEVRVHGCPQDRLVTAITTLARMGAKFDINDEYLCATAPPEGLRAAAVQTDTHPGFMTDWQTPLMVLFTQSQGMSVLHETVFENRLVYVPALQKMGCEIEVFDQCLGGPACRYHDTNARHSAVVRGVSKLKGADVTLPDIRAGFSAVLAAAVADGTSTLRGVHHIERGYHRPFEQFASLGLHIRRQR
jgi:UDP-N-acetylglucosamine enolpyruvyl transferase